MVTWSYLSDSPIWQQQNREELVRFERDAGVNVFVIHPSAIPLPGRAAEWELKQQLLRDQLRTYRSAGTVLLYVSWNAQLSPERWADETFRTEIESWLSRLVAVMKSEGYDYQHWAIYPVDEPTGRVSRSWPKWGRGLRRETLPFVSTQIQGRSVCSISCRAVRCFRSLT